MWDLVYECREEARLDAMFDAYAEIEINERENDMIVELNIGLDVKGEANSIKDCETRAKEALAFLKQKFRSVKSAKYENEYEGPEGPVLEQGLYVRIGTTNTIFETYEVVYQLAVLLKQDCIALYNSRTGQGKLIGPDAGKWGEFDLGYFEQFDDDFLV